MNVILLYLKPIINELNFNEINIHILENENTSYLKNVKLIKYKSHFDMIKQNQFSIDDIYIFDTDKLTILDICLLYFLNDKFSIKLHIYNNLGEVNIIPLYSFINDESLLFYVTNDNFINEQYSPYYPTTDNILKNVYELTSQNSTQYGYVNEQ